MKCPHCKEELILDNSVHCNVDTYGEPVIAVARCCGKGVMVRPIRKIAVDPYIGSRTEDDWGNPLK